MTLEQLHDHMLVALETAREALDNARGNINQERGFADELEKELASALDAVTAAAQRLAQCGDDQP